MDELKGIDAAVCAVAHPVIGYWGNNSVMTKASCREISTRIQQRQSTPRCKPLLRSANLVVQCCQSQPVLILGICVSNGRIGLLILRLAQLNN